MGRDLGNTQILRIPPYGTPVALPGFAAFTPLAAKRTRGDDVSCRPDVLRADGLVRSSRSALESSSREFRAWWSRKEVHPSDVSEDHIEHPTVGRLVLTNLPLIAGDAPNTSVVVTTVRSATTLERLAELARA